MVDTVDDTQVNIKRNKRKLDAIRERTTDGEIDRGYLETTGGVLQTAQGPGQGDVGRLQGLAGNDGTGTEGMEGWKGTTRGDDQRIRSVDTEGFIPTEGADRGMQEAGSSKLTTELTPEQKAERERELTRQRVQRYRERQREEQPSQAQDSYSYVTQEGRTVTPQDVTKSSTKFNLKAPFGLPGAKKPEPVKLFSKTEADDAREALIFVYCKGTSLLDDLLEIVVKGHEPVTIWEMDEDEAALFVDAHLKRAQKSQDAARTARVLLRVYDKLMTSQYLISRSKATYSHIRSNGGLSFR